MDEIIAQIYQYVLEGKQKGVAKRVRTATKQGYSPVVILNEGMINAMAEVGRLFESGVYYIPEMLVSARAMQAGMNVLKPYLNNSEAFPAGRVAIGTVKGDFHDIGKNLVKMMLEGAGFDVIDLGVDVDPGIFIQTAIDGSIDILALSALITTTMPAMIPVIEELHRAALPKKVKVLVGGAPVTEDFAQKINADGYAPDASRAVSIAKSLITR